LITSIDFVRIRKGRRFLYRRRLTFYFNGGVGMKKYIFVTGGVVSGIGKGLVAA